MSSMSQRSRVKVKGKRLVRGRRAPRWQHYTTLARFCALYVEYGSDFVIAAA